jgi:hypothetical protein
MMIPIVIHMSYMACTMSVPMDSHGIFYLYFILYIYRWLKIHPKKLLKDDKKQEMFWLLVAMLPWLHKQGD